MRENTDGGGTDQRGAPCGSGYGGTEEVRHAAVDTVGPKRCASGSGYGGTEEVRRAAVAYGGTD